MDVNPPRQAAMEISLEEFLFSDAALAMSFEGIGDMDMVPQSRSPSSELGAANVVHEPEATAAQDSSLEGIAIDWQASFDQAIAASTANGIGPNQPLHEDVDFSFLDQPGGDLEIEPVAQPQSNPQVPALTAIDEFFIKRGAFRPPAPCNHCRRRRLQCLILQTSPANPNPTKSCSSCVALFRECSLSGSAKRIPSNFETSMPVIGHLHGVNEQGDSPEFPEEGGSSQGRPRTSSVSALSTKRANTRSVRKTRALRNWFSNHMEHPYPSEEEKVALAKESGLSKSQVVNWFANTRRRHRVAAHVQSNQNNRIFLQGSPVPSQLGMSPMERWRNSPPDEEPASATAIESAISLHSSSQGSTDLAWLDGPGSATSGDSIPYPNPNFNDASSNSASSYHSNRSALDTAVLSRSANSSAGEGLGRSRPTSKGKLSKLHAFQCTFCRQSYKKRYDWVRHERSIHLPGLDSWICSMPVRDEGSRFVWRMNETNPQCVFCGHEAPTEEHMQSHEFDACAERPVSERKFTRKDHLWQHLQKFHRCRKWDGWKPDLGLLQHRQDAIRSRCGFCKVVLNSWEDRMDHLASHFRSGLTMESWTGGCGIEDIEGQQS